MIKAEQISDEVVKAAARKQAELDNVEWHTLNDVAIKLRCDHARAALTAGLAAWPGAFPTTTQINRDATEVLILPVRELLSEEIIKLERDKWV
jgi:hypothetical protein